MQERKTRPTIGETSWFVNDRFGMFIHFGLYSLGARHEWLKTRSKVPDDVYNRYFDYFDPDLFDAKQWAKAAKEAGMKYAVITTKHHEGFCLWDSAYTDFKSTNTPFGRDLIREYVDAFRAEGLKIGFYYSLIDWHHEEFPIDILHPLRGIENAEEINKNRDMKKYAQYMRNQVTELLTNYGEIDILWFDFSYSQGISGWWTRYAGKMAEGISGKGKDDWESEKMIELIRSIAPNIILNDRLEIPQDIWTPEQQKDQQWQTYKETGELVTWEACHTFSGSWGYHRDELTWKSHEELIKLLIKNVSLGGNLIMNVGPTARGLFDQRATYALDSYAKWMYVNSRSIYGCTQADDDFFNLTTDGLVLTQKEGRLYLHLFDYPTESTIILKNMAGKFKYMQLLHDASEMIFYENATDVCINLPKDKPDMLVNVVEIMLNN